MKFDRLRSFLDDSQDGAPRGIARFDSAAAMAQAVGSFLHRRDVSTLSGSPLLDRTMPLVNRLPRRLREWAYSLGGMTEAVPRAAVRSIDVDRIAEWIVHLFPARLYPPPSLAHRTARSRIWQRHWTFRGCRRHFFARCGTFSAIPMMPAKA